MSQLPQQTTIPFSALNKNLIPSIKSDPFPMVGSKDRAQFLKPPPIIPLSSIPPSMAPLFSPSFNSLPGSSAMNNMIPTLKPNSWPQTMAFPQRRDEQQQLLMNQAALFNGGLQRQQAFMMTNLSNLSSSSRASSPEDKDDYKDDGGPLEGGGDTRNNRRREMNRLAQQKSRLRKDQLRATLQNENDALKAKIISLEAEVRVWKNMTKKSENEANELRRKIEEYELGIKTFAQSEIEIKSNGRPRSISNERLTIVEEPEETEEAQVEQPGEVEAMQTEAMEMNMAVNKKMDDMRKEIELLTNEIQRMYLLCNKQADTHKMLSQALEDQQLRMKFTDRNEKVENLEISIASTESVTPIVHKSKIKWNGRAPRRGISKRDKMDLLKKMEKLVKLSKEEC